MGMRKFFIFPFLLLFLSGEILWSQDLLTRRIEDDSALRISLEASWFRESPGNVLSKQPEYHTLRGGTRIQVRTERSSLNRDEFAIVLAREQNGLYSGWAQGSWVLTRRRDNDPQGSRIRVFLRSDYNTYVQFRPFSEDKCMMDVVLYDAFAARSVPLPLPFERLFVLPVEEVLNLAGDRFPRRYFDTEPGMYRDSRAFISLLRSRLPELTYVDDGAQDENGSFVFIETLQPQAAMPRNARVRGGVNCSGFVKWVVDGILRPITSERLPIAPLKAPYGSRGSPMTDIWEEEREPFFGLDWCRNLASMASAVLRIPGYEVLEDHEVRNSAFSQLIIRQPGGSVIQAYPGFINSAGFGFAGLTPLLYTLAVDEPGWIYLAAVNRDIAAPVTPDNPRGLPILRQYYHLAVLVPYFTERGVFQVAVFESGEETSFTGFRSRYPGQFVNLVRIPIEASFNP